MEEYIGQGKWLMRVMNENKNKLLPQGEIAVLDRNEIRKLGQIHMTRLLHVRDVLRNFNLPSQSFIWPHFNMDILYLYRSLHIY